MSEKRLDLEIPSVDDLFKVSDDNKNKIVKIPIYQIEDFPEHPFKVKRDEELNKLAESIKEHGVFNPVIVREIGDRHYEMISGHRRKEASKLAGKQEINAIIENVDDDTATIMMVDSNMQREKVLPSERAFAQVNKIRKANGSDAITWDNTAYQEALRRAKDNANRDAVIDENGISVYSLNDNETPEGLINKFKSSSGHMQSLNDKKIKKGAVAIYKKHTNLGDKYYGYVALYEGYENTRKYNYEVDM